MEESKSNTQQVEQETNVLELIVDILNKLFKVLKKYFILLLIPFVLAFLYSYKKSKLLSTTYSATISFSLSETGSQGNFNPSLSQQGFGFNNPNKLREYSFTEKLGSKLLFKEYYYNGKEDYLINHYLRLFLGYNESYFHNFTDVASLNTQEYSVFKRVLTAIKNSSLIENNNADIYFITTSTTDENFTLLLCEAFYENLIDYYIERSTKRESSAVQFLQKRVNQLKLDLEKSEYNLASYKDRANNLVTYKAELEEIKYNRTKQLLEKDFMESSIKLEIAKTNLNAIKPLFQVIDAPHLPLQSTPESKTKLYAINLAISFVVVILLIAIFFFREYYWKDIKKNFKTALHKNENNNNSNS